MNTKTISELSVDTQVLLDHLKTVQPDQIIPYEDLTKAIGKNVQTKARHLLESARRKLIRENQILFDVVFNHGLKRVQGAGIVAVGNQGVKKIGRHARRTAKKIGCIGESYHDLTKEEKHRFNGLGAILTVVSHSTRENQVKTICNAAEERMPLAKTLALFTGTRPDVT